MGRISARVYESEQASTSRARARDYHPSLPSTVIETSDYWTWQQVRDVLAGAWSAVLSAPLERGRDLPAELRCAWPATAPERWSLPAPARLARVSPSAAQMAQAEIALPWILLIARGRDRRVVAGRLCGARWKVLAKADGRSPEYLRGELWRRCLQSIADQVTAHGKYSIGDFTDLTNFASR